MKETKVDFNHETGTYQKIRLSELYPDQNPFQNYSSMTKLSYDHVTEPKILQIGNLMLVTLVVRYRLPLSVCTESRNFNLAML